MKTIYLWLFACLMSTACALPPSGTSTGGRADEDPQARVNRLERARDQDPGDIETRENLGVAYYQLARQALDQDRELDYLNALGKSLDEILEASRLEPEAAGPHVWMGIISAYQNDLNASMQSFKNAQRLEPRGLVNYLNIGQVYIYQGDLVKARRWIKSARKKGAGGAYVELIECLAAWRSGDLVEARDLFDVAYGLNPDVVKTWDEAPVDTPIESFQDFTAYCCSNHTCGPNMGDACKRMELVVQERNVTQETLRKELELEAERRRKLRDIYERRKDLKIEIDD